jgi:hypothetical protein
MAEKAVRGEFVDRFQSGWQKNLLGTPSSMPFSTMGSTFSTTPGIRARSGRLLPGRPARAVMVWRIVFKRGFLSGEDERS